MEPSSAVQIHHVGGPNEELTGAPMTSAIRALGEEEETNGTRRSLEGTARWEGKIGGLSSGIASNHTAMCIEMFVQLADLHR